MPLNSAAQVVDKPGMDLVLQFGAMALTSTMILRLALAERARQVAEPARVRVDDGVPRGRAQAARR